MARKELQEAMTERRRIKEEADQLRKFRAERRHVYEEARVRYESFFSEVGSQKADLAAKYAKMAQEKARVLRVARKFRKDADLHQERLRQVRNWAAGQACQNRGVGLRGMRPGLRQVHGGWCLSWSISTSFDMCLWLCMDARTRVANSLCFWQEASLHSEDQEKEADTSKFVTETEIRDLLDSFFDDFPGSTIARTAENAARVHACARAYHLTSHV